MKRNYLFEILAFTIIRVLSAMVILVLLAILVFIIVRGASVISWEFLTEMPQEGMTKGGILPAIIGTLSLVAVSIVWAFPVGVMSAIFMNEYMQQGWYKRLIRMMTNNLAGIPSIVFGLFGMSLFVNDLKFGDSILAGSLTLGILTLPVIIRTTEEALVSVDQTFREASLALGATRLQTITKVILPSAIPNILTGLILSVGRVSGETAPILFTVAAYFLPKLPSSLFDQVMALPYHLYVITTSGTNIEESRPMAYGTALVLLIIVLSVNGLAYSVKYYYQKSTSKN
ncbi:MAG: phosphate ABC transporter permease PstA [Saprospiraceae bacterium]|nr:phosphate ABC transporter permease PstA [Saprospiraceae bacterium]HMW39706.1 phosphate ABC transporter permease PstA [Saprospiraceae bacterium]HMX88398.1 phosphate ABC transporter permease PstA [Saprospiraceae bacterium]HMZ39040.1 phosphate ABC transporter permease PstA [Saprospiraceae bacterium]HNA64549.1 phosphate ABC transporter permease PstA [Saprospiraceae bacterium]